MTSEERKGFTVKDRRHFTAEGDVRQALLEDEVPSQPAGAERPRPPAPPQPKTGERVDFGSFLVSLASQASLLLGLDAAPGSEPQLDLAGARQIIGVLEMLEAKTAGRRTPEEDEILEGLLYELRMEYVSRTRVSGA